MEAPQEQTGIEADTQHPEALFAAFAQIFRARRDDAAMLAASPEFVLDALEVGGDSGPFPLFAVARTRGVIGGPEEKNVRAADLAKLRNVLAGGDRFHNRHYQDMLVRLLRVEGQALPPTCRPFGADATDTRGWIAGVGHGQLELVTVGARLL